MEVVEQSHPHLGGGGEWTILKPVAGEAESGPHVVEEAVQSCKTLNRMKRDALRGIEYAQVHFFDRFAPFVAHTARRRFPLCIVGRERDARVDTVGICLSEVHSDQTGAVW